MTLASLLRVTARDLAREAVLGVLLAPIAGLLVGLGVLAGMGAW